MSRLWDYVIVLTVGVLIGIFLSQKSCNDESVSGGDTTYITGISDTLIIRDTIRQTIYKPIASTTYAPPINNYFSIDSLDSIRVYTNSIVDSSGSVTVRDSVRGVLLSQDISLFSKATYINRVDTIKITLPTKDRFRLGVGASLNDSLQLGAYVVASKGRFNYMGGYNLKRKSITLGIGLNLIK